jgi:hypothetical protein
VYGYDSNLPVCFLGVCDLLNRKKSSLERPSIMHFASISLLLYPLIPPQSSL